MPPPADLASKMEIGVGSVGAANPHLASFACGGVSDIQFKFLPCEHVLSVVIGPEFRQQSMELQSSSMAGCHAIAPRHASRLKMRSMKSMRYNTRSSATDHDLSPTA